MVHLADNCSAHFCPTFTRTPKCIMAVGVEFFMWMCPVSYQRIKFVQRWFVIVLEGTDKQCRQKFAPHHSSLLFGEHRTEGKRVSLKGNILKWCMTHSKTLAFITFYVSARIALASACQDAPLSYLLALTHVNFVTCTPQIGTSLLPWLLLLSAWCVRFVPWL